MRWRTGSVEKLRFDAKRYPEKISDQPPNRVMTDPSFPACFSLNVDYWRLVLRREVCFNVARSCNMSFQSQLSELQATSFDKKPYSIRSFSSHSDFLERLRYALLKSDFNLYDQLIGREGSRCLPPLMTVCAS